MVFLLYIIESDNCKSQYKSAQQFFNMQNIANKYTRLLIYLYGVAGHGKGEDDHVGGMAKVAVRQEIARGAYFANAEEVVSFLTHKFGVKEVRHSRNVIRRCGYFAPINITSCIQNCIRL